MTALPSTPLWRPSEERVEDANLTAFTRWLTTTRGVDFADYEDLWRYSVDDVSAFWSAIWEYFDIQFDGAAEPVLQDPSMPGATWFPNVGVNYVEHIFRDKDPGSVAIHHASETAAVQSVSWGQLRERTTAIAGGLRRLGVGRGDRVGGYLPNIPDAVAALLATTSIGAIWACCSPDFGARTVLDRFAQINPKVLLAVDGYRYGGRVFDRSDVVASLASEIPGLEHVVTFGLLSGTGWQEGFEDPDYELSFDRVPFDHPLWVLYSSGTTGLPKGIVHSHGGVLLEQLKYGSLHVNASAGDRVFWYTTTGWMMWNFLVGVLLTDAEIVLYDGSPGFPDLGALWDLAAAAGITCFGTSAAYIGSNIKVGMHPRAGRDLSALKSVGSTGSALSTDGYEWVYHELGPDIWLWSVSGGTDACTGFVVGVVTLPVVAGEIQAKALGCDVHAFDDDGRSVVGEVGELVITQPMPSMPVFFWNDSDGSRYRESYFDTYPGIWRHGDWLELLEHGSAVVHGRSDSTINRGGIRMGTAEIYRVVLTLDEIVDALVVDVPRPSHRDGWMALFVVLREGTALCANVIAEIRNRLRAQCSPRHVPDDVIAVNAVPRTLTGKILEVPVKRILMGQDPDRVVSAGGLADPESLQPFIALADNMRRVDAS